MRWPEFSMLSLHVSPLHLKGRELNSEFVENEKISWKHRGYSTWLTTLGFDNEPFLSGGLPYSLRF